MHQVINETIKKIILKATHSSKINKVELIQNLWSGYGKLCRIELDKRNIILKLIQKNKTSEHPRGWDTDFSHQRKVKSYQVETNWYRNFNNKNENARTADYLDAGEIDNYQFIILEDLKDHSYESISNVNQKQVELSIKWLANFHANYLNQKPTGLWETGTYWHLKTRPDEFSKIKDTELKEAAPLIDQKLNSAEHMTLVHGDAKVANFLFNKNQAAAVDFQYIGAGVGVKDLAYFMSSIYSEDELKKNEELLLSAYFKELSIALEGKSNEIEIEWRELYPFAWCDFYRFLQGWSPQHPKINSYSEAMKNKVLKCL